MNARTLILAALGVGVVIALTRRKSSPSAATLRQMAASGATQDQMFRAGATVTTMFEAGIPVTKQPGTYNTFLPGSDRNATYNPIE